MKLKVCGMKQNTREVAELAPHYLGFIFWEPSSRYFSGDIGPLPDNIRKVGVFVDEGVEDLIARSVQYSLDLIQLHGNESPEYCSVLRRELRKANREDIKLIKVFTVGGEFDFTALTPYETIVDYYLFDTRGKLPGGNGEVFDWEILRQYSSSKPFFLSGGIGLSEIPAIEQFLESEAGQLCHAVDVNSRFELEPGLKNTTELKEFSGRLSELHVKENEKDKLI